MTLNPETAIPETIDLRQRRGRIPTSDFRCRPTNNPMSLDNHADVHVIDERNLQIQGRSSLGIKKRYTSTRGVLDEVEDNLWRGY
ncbi:hypothetical protein CUMW_243300 [Citrus unshiu]|nr:hypothetical protein CUMW_243300 [Citrus unshiu]